MQARSDLPDSLCQTYPRGGQERAWRGYWTRRACHAGRSLVCRLIVGARGARWLTRGQFAAAPAADGRTSGFEDLPLPPVAGTRCGTVA